MTGHPPRTATIAVLMACHNRRESTLQCLDALLASRLPPGYRLRVFLVDDGSSDGTAEAVGATFPTVRIIPGDGSLYWCGGTRLAWAVALREAPEAAAFLWLNDDVRLHDGAVHDVLERYGQVRAEGADDRVVLCGATRDPENGNVTYGLRSTEGTIPPNGQWQRFSHDVLLNGNFVLIPRRVFNRVGGMSERFTHSMGDVEYGLRCFKQGIAIELTPRFVGDCAHPGPPAWRDPRVPIRERLRHLAGPKGLPPREYYHLIRLLRPYTWPASMLKLPLIALAPRLFDRKLNQLRRTRPAA